MEMLSPGANNAKIRPVRAPVAEESRDCIHIPSARWDGALRDRTSPDSLGARVEQLELQHIPEARRRP